MVGPWEVGLTLGLAVLLLIGALFFSRHPRQRMLRFGFFLERDFGDEPEPDPSLEKTQQWPGEK